MWMMKDSEEYIQIELFVGDEFMRLQSFEIYLYRTVDGNGGIINPASVANIRSYTLC